VLSLRPPRAARRALALLVGVAALAAVCSCSSGSPSAGGSPAGPAAGDSPVLVLGDSLTVGARLWGDLEAAAEAAGWSAEVVAEDGRDVGWGLDQVRARDRVPEVVVVGLGTNPGTSPATFAGDARALVSELVARGAGTVVWWPPEDATDADRAARAAALRAEAGTRLRVPDWPAELARHPDWLAPDGIHLTNDGYRGLAAFLVHQLDTLP
jgi:lysophospholipase L1-like esterase